MLRFRPEYKNAVWGGRRLESVFGRVLPDGPVGESWELADFDAHASVVATGERRGERLGDLWRGGALGGSASGEFPFLLKWLDTHDFLSVQVHPDESFCARHGRCRPKTEAWLVARAETGAIIYLGHHAGLDAESFERSARRGGVEQCLVELRPGPGELLMVEAGTLHAIGPGWLLLEVQQPSDTTFRAYDWGRTGLEGKPRELHLDDAREAVRYERSGPPRGRGAELIGPTFSMRLQTPGSKADRDGLRVYAAHAGTARLRTESEEIVLGDGDVVVAEPGDGVVTALDPCVLLSES